MQILTPHVYWAQRHAEIYLRVDLSDAKVRRVHIADTHALTHLAFTYLMRLNVSELYYINALGVKNVLS